MSAKNPYANLRGLWVQGLIDQGLVEPLPNRISVYQVIITGGGPHTSTWCQKYPPGVLSDLIVEHIDL